jgi:protein-S-isoprenylcysteine O-methyltransferase Ste14
MAAESLGMTITPGRVFAVIWIGWIVSWLVAAFWANRTQKRAVSWDSVVYRIAIIVGAVLLTPQATRRLAAAPLWHVGLVGAYALAGLTLAGLLFAWWARIHLGRLWSGSITRKEGHRVVETGPYGLVRHPIYTGLITAILASAIAAATWPALAGGVLVTIGLCLKARIEERFLTAELGPDAYGSYRSRVPMLVPGIRGWR